MSDSPTPSAQVRRERAGFVGPLFGWELLRLARRGTPTWARVLVAIVLLGALWLVFQSELPSDELNHGSSAVVSKLMTEFASTFSLVFLMAQLAVICLLTPIFVAGAIIEEKDRKTIEFLLATDLTGREIVLGKYLSRVVQMLCVLLAGVPILAATQVWGGVDVTFIAIAYLIAFTAILSVAGISVVCASVREWHTSPMSSFSVRV